MTCPSVDIFNIYQLLHYSPRRPDPLSKSPAPTNIFSINVSPLSPDLRKSFSVDPFSPFPCCKHRGSSANGTAATAAPIVELWSCFPGARPSLLQGGLRDHLGPRPSFTMISPLFPLPAPELTRRGQASEPNAHGPGLRRLQVYFRSVIWVGGSGMCSCAVPRGCCLYFRGLARTTSTRLFRLGLVHGARKQGGVRFFKLTFSRS
jgi:hypothetical protein